MFAVGLRGWIRVERGFGFGLWLSRRSSAFRKLMVRDSKATTRCTGYSPRVKLDLEHSTTHFC